MDGFVLIDKEPGYTSKGVSMKVGKFFHTTRVGHIGTLDPFASGLLLVMINKATKSLLCFEDFSKRYVATIKLGEFKDTMDTEGTTTETRPIPKLNREFIEKTLNKFLGKIVQTVPLTSAVHVNGRRLYEYARKGESVDLPVREIEIFDIKLVDFTDEEITFEAYVSKGTYIRVLGADIAKELGTVGYLNALRRIAVGPFTVEEASKIDEISLEKVQPIGKTLMRFMKTKTVDDIEALDVKNGKIKVYPLEVDEEKLLIVDSKNNPIALYTNVDNQYIFRRGLF